MRLRLSSALVFVLFMAGCGGSSSSEEATDPVTRAPTTTVAAAPTTTSAPASSDEIFTRANWDLLASDPKSHKGASVNIVGKIFTTPERDADGIYFQMWADPQNSEWNTVVAYADASLQLATDDYVRVRGTVQGAFSGQNAFGADVTAPTILATSVQRVSATAAASPALQRLGRVSYTQGGITITIRKVEIAGDETRAFIAVKNGSAYNFNIYSSSARFIVDGRQYDQDYSGNYEQLSSDLAPGVFTSGVITFPIVDANASSFRLIIEGSSDDSNIGDYGSLEWNFTWE